MEWYRTKNPIGAYIKGAAWYSITNGTNVLGGITPSTPKLPESVSLTASLTALNLLPCLNRTEKFDRLTGVLNSKSSSICFPTM